MQLRLLGPLELWGGDGLLDTGPPQQRAVLAALAADAGQPVAPSALVERVWGHTPPGRARDALYVYIAKLRRILQEAAGDGAPVRLLRRSGGYLLEIAPAQLDAHRFRSLVADAGERGREESEQAELLEQALELWRGTPLADIPGEWTVGYRAGWQRERIEAAIALSRAHTRLGRPQDSLGAIGALVAENALNESLTGALMRALHAAGRRADALAAYDAIRTRLSEELGVEPHPKLQKLHLAILRDDLGRQPSDEAAHALPAPATRAAGAPAQLPLDVRGFTNRVEELARLDDVLNRSGEQPTAVLVAALTGTAGVGKTALAVNWAHRVASRFPDGQLYVNLRGFGPDGACREPAEVLRAMLAALGVPPKSHPVTTEALAALYRSHLAGQRMLVLLDNARDADQIRPLLPGAPGSLVIVTSRNRLSSLAAAEGAQMVGVDLFTDDQARRLLARRLGGERIKTQPKALEEIVAACAGLPLALNIVAARACTHPAEALATIARELRGDRLDALAGEDAVSDVRTVFSWSYHALDAASARLFRLLALHPGPDIDLGAAASLAGVARTEARRMLRELAQAHLVTEYALGRYAVHDLLRAYAEELAADVDSPEDRDAALGRIFEHYLRSLQAATPFLSAYREPVQVQAAAPDPGVTPERFDDRQEALAWCTTEHQVLLAAVRLAHAESSPLTWQLAWGLVAYLDRQGHWQDWVDTQSQALDTARRTGDPEGEAHALESLGDACTWLSRYDHARVHFTQALALYERLRDENGRGRVHLGMSIMTERLGRYEEALHHGEQCLERFTATGHRTGQANALNVVGWCHAHLNDYERALTTCQHALDLHVELGNHSGQAATWDSIGYAHHHLGHFDEAMECYQRSLALYGSLMHRALAAEVLTHLGETYEAVGDIQAARDAWQKALAINEELNHDDANMLRAKLRRLEVSSGEPTFPS